MQEDVITSLDRLIFNKPYVYPKGSIEEQYSLRGSASIPSLCTIHKITRGECIRTVLAAGFTLANEHEYISDIHKAFGKMQYHAINLKKLLE